MNRKIMNKSKMFQAAFLAALTGGVNAERSINEIMKRTKEIAKNAADRWRIF